MAAFLFRWYNFHANLIWLDGPFNKVYKKI